MDPRWGKGLAVYTRQPFKMLLLCKSCRHPKNPSKLNDEVHCSVCLCPSVRHIALVYDFSPISSGRHCFFVLSKTFTNNCWSINYVMTNVIFYDFPGSYNSIIPLKTPAKQFFCSCWTWNWRIGEIWSKTCMTIKKHWFWLHGDFKLM